MSKLPTLHEIEQLVQLAKREGVQQLTVGKFTVVLEQPKENSAASAIGFQMAPEPETE